MHNYVILSLETHLFFARIMKEHSLFLQAGFSCKDEECIQKADWFRCRFEEFLCDVVRLANGRVGFHILKSEELVTPFTLSAENKTSCLSGVPIDTGITAAQQRLRAANRLNVTRELLQAVNQLNRRALELLDGLIDFKEQIRKAVADGNLFTTNYPLLIEHIRREACLYRDLVRDLTQNRRISQQSLLESEIFWNRIMMEHALFIRGLLDPCEEKLIQTADDFADTYCQLLKAAERQECLVSEELRRKTLNTTLQYQDFKTAGARGILNNQISSIILPLLADHVLREANHFIRILKFAGMTQER